MGTIAKCLENVTAYTRRRHDQRINRRLDDRDNILIEALKNLEQAPASIYPQITSGPSLLSSETATGLTLQGVNFIGDAVKASYDDLLVGATAELDFEAVLPGEQTITVVISDTGAALATSVSGTTITVVHGDGGGAGGAGAYTAAQVAASINADAEAKYMVNVTVETAGDVSGDSTCTLTGGEGTLMTLSVGGVDIDGTNAGNGITNVTDTVITFDIDPTDIDGAGTALEAGMAYPVMLRADAMLARYDLAVGPAALVNGTGVSVTQGPGTIHAVITLNDTPVPLVDEAGVVAYGSLKLLDLPAGYVVFMGASTDLALTKSSTGVNLDWDGDFGLGTAAANNNAVLATTEQNLIPTTATPQAVAGATTANGVSTATESGAILDGHTSALDVYLNILVDDADHDVTTTACNIIVNGTITLVYAHIGDN